VLAAANVEALARLLADRLPADPQNVRVLAKYLKQIQVKVVRLADFRPSKATIEKNDVEAVVAEFRKFLETALAGGGRNTTTVVELR
jgi:hypothetical protein